jgi:hypothetical protein
MPANGSSAVFTGSAEALVLKRTSCAIAATKRRMRSATVLFFFISKSFPARLFPANKKPDDFRCMADCTVDPSNVCNIPQAFWKMYWLTEKSHWRPFNGSVSA